MITGVGTGKTFALLFQAWHHCETHPNALAMIVRKELTDLKDSTIKDFNLYFNVNLPTSRTSYKFPNGSEIMFRHGNENDLAVLKNINLSYAGIEQAEEYDNGEVFNWLRQRLRRTQVPVRQLSLIANANGRNWLWELFVNQADEQEHYRRTADVLGQVRPTGEAYYKRTERIGKESQVYECWTANSFVNACNLPDDTLLDWMVMEKNAPNHYRRMILNMFDQFDDDDTVFTADDIDVALNAEFLFNPEMYDATILAVDIARYGQDKSCAVVLKQRGPIHWEEIFVEYWQHKDLMHSTGKVMDMSATWQPEILVVDGDGIGAGVVDRLRENRVNVVEYRGGMRKDLRHEDRYFNRTTEDAFWVKDLIQQGRLKVLPEAVTDMQTMRYKYKSDGVRILVSKEDMRSRGVKSPDHFDALKMACAQVEGIKQSTYRRVITQPKYARVDSPFAYVR